MLKSVCRLWRKPMVMHHAAIIMACMVQFSSGATSGQHTLEDIYNHQADSLASLQVSTIYTTATVESGLGKNGGTTVATSATITMCFPSYRVEKSTSARGNFPPEVYHYNGTTGKYTFFNPEREMQVLGSEQHLPRQAEPLEGLYPFTFLHTLSNISNPRVPLLHDIPHWQDISTSLTRQQWHIAHEESGTATIHGLMLGPNGIVLNFTGIARKDNDWLFDRIDIKRTVPDSLARTSIVSSHWQSFELDGSRRLPTIITLTLYDHDGKTAYFRRTTSLHAVKSTVTTSCHDITSTPSFANQYIRFDSDNQIFLSSKAEVAQWEQMHVLRAKQTSGPKAAAHIALRWGSLAILVAIALALYRRKVSQ